MEIVLDYIVAFLAKALQSLHRFDEFDGKLYMCVVATLSLDCYYRNGNRCAPLCFSMFREFSVNASTI